MGHIGASGREAMSLFSPSLGVWKVVTSTFKKKKITPFLSHHYKESRFLPERAQPPSVRVVTARQRWPSSLKAARELGEVQRWQCGLAVLPMERGRASVFVFILYDRYHTFPYVCICIGFLVYDIFP